MRSTPKSRKLAKEISRKLPVGRSTEIHKIATDYDRRASKLAIEEGLEDAAIFANSEVVPAERVYVHFKCCRCDHREVFILSDLGFMTFLCDKCDKMENYMELVGVIIV